VSAALLAVLVAAGRAQQGRPASTSPLPAAPKPLAIPAGKQVFYDVNQMPWEGLGGTARRKTVLGEHVTFSMAELSPSPPDRQRAPGGGHHHDYEQVLFGLEGGYDQTAADQAFRVARWTAVLEPPNVPHMVTRVYGPEKSISIEFIPLARRDLVPPRPKVDYPASPTPKPIPPDRQVFMDFNAAPWVGKAGEARFKAIFGETCTLILWHLPAANFRGTSASGHHHTAEQITYILEGRAQMRVGDQVRTVGPGTLIMIPADVEHLPMTAINGEDIVLLDFQPVVRRDLLERMGKS
jgi:quercetin dioxygenase-like cupin family protein